MTSQMVHDTEFTFADEFYGRNPLQDEYYESLKREFKADYLDIEDTEEYPRY